MVNTIITTHAINLPIGTTLAQSIDMEPKSSVDFAALRKRVGSEGPVKRNERN